MTCPRRRLCRDCGLEAGYKHGGVAKRLVTLVVKYAGENFEFQG